MDHPKVTIGGREYAVPEFSVKEQRKIIPLMMRAGQVDWTNMAADDFDVVYDIAYTAIFERTRKVEGFAPPQMPREDFDELPVRLDEIMKLIPVIGQQAGMSVAKAAKPGEA